ncbi:hypothetical protein [Pseudobacteriovorax antillogorgiicola]|uniref:Uncharacterized protein n=1 Tax=Pseudobacteriovorax antillogorgiicola TaxID=1513793 RepID=A0A1Y6C2F4_9BACT|nr:hypothetical protein [Pseudobacteriovorax antillogorgiicola]TCS51124.1 hypothetical protein EDD56_1115 [Pseudobacteriovorax antillogorgiicola]SMF38544.1 hypothetical protein SAMN06296036_111172 [Pseudobacteriovorax antillogorgiicola]
MKKFRHPMLSIGLILSFCSPALLARPSSEDSSKIQRELISQSTKIILLQKEVEALKKLVQDITSGKIEIDKLNAKFVEADILKADSIEVNQIAVKGQLKVKGKTELEDTLDAKKGAKLANIGVGHCPHASCEYSYETIQLKSIHNLRFLFGEDRKFLVRNNGGVEAKGVIHSEEGATFGEVAIGHCPYSSCTFGYETLQVPENRNLRFMFGDDNHFTLYNSGRVDGFPASQ